MQKRFVIGFGGEAEHGKSTCAILAEEYLRSRFGDSVQVLAFAERLKQICRILFRLDSENVHTTRGKAAIQPHLGKDVTSRMVLQKVGSELCREQLPKILPELEILKDQTIWVWNIEQDIIQHSGDSIVIQDVRFPDEEKMLRKHGAFIVKVVRPGYKPVIPVPKHQSETAKDLIHFDYVIENDRGLPELKAKVQELLSKIVCTPLL